MLFTAGLVAFLAAAVESSIDKRTAIPRITTGSFTIVSACFVVGNWKLGLPMAATISFLSFFNWMFLFLYRHPGKYIKESDTQ